MKILNIMQGTHLGGMEQASLRLMVGLKGRGYDLQVLSLTPVGPLGDLLEKSRIPCQGLAYRGKGGWRSFLNLRKILQQVDGDALLMTGHNLLAMLALGRLAAGHRVLAQHFHHAGVKPRWQWRLIYAVACKRFQAITFPSAFIRDEAVALYPPVAALAHVVPNPVPLAEPLSTEARRQARSQWDIADDRPVVGNAGWLIPRKRFDIFLQVARRVTDSLPDAVFLVAGDGPERARLESLARSLGVARQLRWLGWQKDLGAFYRSLDLLLFNSDWDAMGMSPLEAMSRGVPVVASVRHGGLGEVIEHGRSGLLFREHDLDPLTKAVLELLRDPERRRQFGAAGRRRIAEVAEPQHCAAAYEALLKGQGR